MKAYIRLEVCKNNGESRFSMFCFENDGQYIKIGIGNSGEYSEESLKITRISTFQYMQKMAALNEVTFSSWPNYEEDFVYDGCQPNTWNLELVDTRGHMRGIHGKGAYPHTFPYSKLPWILDICGDFAGWLYSDDEKSE